MLNYNEIKRDKRRVLALTGLTPKEFEELYGAFRTVYERRYPADKTRAGKARKRKAGGGRKGRLATTEQKLLFSLGYQQGYPLQGLLGEVVELSQSRATRWIHELMPLLHQALDELGVLPERKPDKFARHERNQSAPPELIIDGTDRRRQRPKSPTKPALHYRGKRKTHSDKTVLVVNAKTNRVGYLSQTYAGKTHDKKVADDEGIRYPSQTILYKDPGFQGDEPKVRATHQPKKSRARRS